jgi:hypothetical protein
MLTRVFKAMIFNTATYAEVAEDNEATIDAAFLILIYVMAATIPNAMNVSATWLMIALVIPLALIEWLVFAGLTCVFAGRLFHGEGTLPGIYRAMGFSVSPGIFYLLAAIPTVGVCISALISFYIFVANVIAAKAAMKIGIVATLVSMFLASTVAGLLLGCLAVPLILMLGPENLITNLEQFR